MAENFTTFTETDPNGRISKTATKISWTALTRNEDAYVYKDYEADYFLENFTINFSFSITSSAGGGLGVAFVLAITNDIDDVLALDVAGKSFYYVTIARAVAGSSHYIILTEIDSGTPHQDYTANILSLGTDYYVTVKRDESVGTYGTIYLYIYDDAARTNLLDTLTVTLNTSKKDFRYIMALTTLNDGSGAVYSTGYLENLDILYATVNTQTPSVTTQAATDVSAVTATGNGNVISLGVPSATQHGHVWATFINPTLETGSYTENGVPAATGAFTSSLTGLIQNTLYYCRAYITNALGTFYSAGSASFTTTEGVPTVTTYAATDVATLTAVGVGSVNNNGGSSITQYGVCWSTSANPTTTDSKTEEGAMADDELGSFNSTMTSLTAATLYHYRAYATNGTGTGYGADKTFTTAIVGTPIVITEQTLDVTATTATGRGSIVDPGGSAVTQHGHCWNTSTNPTTANDKTENGAGAVGAFSSEATVLLPGTTYYFRAYATNTQGTSYGNNNVITTTSVADPSIPSTRRQIAILGEHFVYTSMSGTQRKLLGVEF